MAGNTVTTFNFIMNYYEQATIKKQQEKSVFTIIKFAGISFNI